MVHIADEGKRECPTCGAKVDTSASECPECGEVFEAVAAAPAEEESTTEEAQAEEATEETATEEAPAEEGAAAEEPTEEESEEEPTEEAEPEEYAEAPSETPGRGKFFAGILLMLIGGPGIALGSYLHNTFRILGSAWDEYGPLDTMTGIVGIVIMVIGIALVWMSGKGAKEEDWEEEK